MDREELIVSNLDWWNERAPLHVASAFYHVDDLINGASALDEFEERELVSHGGESLLHLQCHIGTDTISWARRGFDVTGLDFSEVAIREAAQLGSQCGVTVKWITSDLYQAPQTLGRTFDVVYTGKGALVWLDDIKLWADVVNQLLKPGGRLYLVEFHPVSEVLGEKGWSIEYDYFSDGEAIIEDQTMGSYADRDVTTRANRTATWQHTLGDIISALTGAGLSIKWLHEYPHTHFERTDALFFDPERRTYQVPPGTPRLPLLFSLLAEKLP